MLPVWRHHRLRGHQSAQHTMFRALQDVLTMGINLPQCIPLQSITTAQLSHLHTRRLAGIRETHRRADFRAFSGHLEDKALSRRIQVLIALLSFIALFTLFCLIIWGASRPFKAQISVKSLAVHNFYVGEGSDSTGVPTKLLTLNSTLRLSVYNPATIFGIHVTSTPIDLIYSEIVVASGQLKKYYQPRNSHRRVSVNLEGIKVPMYGAASTLTVPPTSSPVPMTLSFKIRSRGYVVGQLVKTTHIKQISCPVGIDSTSNKAIVFKKNTCTYE